MRLLATSDDAIARICECVSVSVCVCVCVCKSCGGDLLKQMVYFSRVGGGEETSVMYAPQ